MSKGSRIGDVASMAGVSTMTVSRYINKSGYVGEKTGKRIEQAIAQLRYRPNQLARSLQTNTTANIAVILGNMSSYSSGEVLKGVESVTFGRAYNILVGNTAFNAERERQYLDILLRKQIDGILLAPTLGKGNELHELCERGVPLAFLFREIPDINVDIVRFDVEHDSYRLVHHLLALGHKRIALLCRKVDMLHGAPHATGYTTALERAGIAVDTALQQSVENASVLDGVQRMEAFFALPDPPTAIFATTNLLAGGVLSFCRDHRVRIPEDLMLVSSDSFGELAPLIHPTVTHVELPMQALGRSAAELLLQRIHSVEPVPTQRILMQGQLVVGESTGE